MASQTFSLYLSGYAEATQPGIQALLFDETSGQARTRWSFAGIANPSFISVHPNGRWLFAVSETSAHAEGRAGQVWALELPAAGSQDQPRELNHQPSGGDWPCHLNIDASGKWLLVTNYQSGSVSVFPILENGALGEMADQVQHSGHGPNPERQEGPHTHSSIFTPDQRFVIVADLGLDQLVIYAFDAQQGKLREHVRVDSQPGSGPRHMVFHPNQRLLYVSHELNNTVVVYDYDAQAHSLQARQTLTTIPQDTAENVVADIHITPAGDRLLISNRGHNSLALFPLNPDGTLREATFAPCGGDWPRQFTFSPSGTFVLVANQKSGEVAVFPLLTDAPGLGEPRTRVPMAQASCVAFAQ